MHNLEGEIKDKARKFWNKMNLLKLKLCAWFKGKWEVKNESFCFHSLLHTDLGLLTGV